MLRSQHAWAYWNLCLWVLGQQTWSWWWKGRIGVQSASLPSLKSLALFILLTSPRPNIALSRWRVAPDSQILLLTYFYILDANLTDIGRIRILFHTWAHPTFAPFLTIAELKRWIRWHFRNLGLHMLLNLPHCSRRAEVALVVNWLETHLLRKVGVHVAS